MSDVVVRMPASLHAAVKAQAAKDGLSMAEAMRVALRRYVGETAGQGDSIGFVGLSEEAEEEWFDR